MTACGLITACGIANAASTYAASANLILDVRSNASLDGLWYRGSNTSYEASTQATADGSTVVKNKVINVNKALDPGFSIGQFLNPDFGPRKPLDDLFLVPEKGPKPSFDGVEAINQGAEGRGGNTTSTSTRPARFTANVDGIARDPVELSNSKVRWDLLIFFQNVTDTNLLLNWLIAYSFHNEAHADPRGSAFSESSVKVQWGKLDSKGDRVGNSIFKDSAAACGFNHPECSALGSNPNDKVSPELAFMFNLAPGEIGYFNVELVAAGNASVVPIPASLPLFGSGLALLSWFTRRKKFKQAAG
ncbi:MAG: hypothetical protein ACKE8R_02990 [Methylophagaceae bacterium]